MGINIKIDGLIKKLGDFTLDVSQYDFEAGKIYALVGPNGSGKTTLLNLLNLLDKPSSGQITFGEENLSGIQKKMYLLLEDPYLFNTTVEKNIKLGLKFRNIPKAKWAALVAVALDMVELGDFKGRYAKNLSKGETKRVALARGLAVNPKILLLDEPFANIDKEFIPKMEELLLKLNKDNHTTIVFTTHDIFQAYRLTDNILSLVDGKLTKGSLINHFKGEIERRDGQTFAKISEEVSFNVTTEKFGHVNVIIDPTDIIILENAIASSARNCFKCCVKKINIEKQIVRVFAQVAKDVELVSTITNASYEQMAIKLDKPIYLMFKSTAVQVF